MGAYSRDEKLLMHFFQDSLAGAAVIWYTNLEASRIRTWKDLITAFLRQYQYNSDMAPDRTQLQNMIKWEHESFKEYAQRWRDLAAQVAPLMVEREMVTMMVDTLPVFYYEKLVGYMPTSFVDLVFAGERIEVGFKRGKFDYVSPVGASSRRTGIAGAKKEEGDAYTVTSTPACTHPAKGAHAPTGGALQAPAPTRPHPANNAHLGTSPNTTRNFSPSQAEIFTPIPMRYGELLPSLIANQLAVVIPGRVLQSPFPKWYNPSVTYAYHGGALGHSVEQCLALKSKVQGLIEAGWLIFQEDGPNIKTNPLANHGGGAVNAIKVSRSHRPKLLKDVMTSRRFIYKALQKAGMIPHGGHREDSCLMHSGILHDMETCSAVRNLLQQMIDQGRLEVGNEGEEEQHVYMQSVDKEGPKKPKPLVIHFTRDTAPPRPQHPSAVSGGRPIPFPYENNHAVPWRYAPLGGRKEEAIDIGSLSAKVTNITGLSGITRSGRVFAPLPC
ncbi:uncharacterized protein [Glycine max]|uniref:uncharacterized protein n=1 Tax=Glycine max TaxID=3847 RepID=UPI0003DE748D|nr:uncharacterized protein LOC100793471 [Glycine max]|eukprot:XP_006599810.1 uncharacterized protein LOC100793471 [Glycine max]